MSLTKETIGATATQDPGRPRPASGQKTEESGHPQPVCIEVPVTVQGVRPATDPGKREPFTESTRTVIVFANGAVLRLGTSVNPGQLIFLTNEHTKKEVVCQVVKSKTYQNVPGYVELEFTEPNAGFWAIHFPGERSEPRSEPHAPGVSQTFPKLQLLAPVPLPLPQDVPAASPRLDAASVSASPMKAAEGERAPKSESHPTPAVPAEIPRAAPPARKEPSRAEEKLSASDPSPQHPEPIRPAPAASPRSKGSASVSEPLIFSSTKKSVTPAASVAQPHEDEHVAPVFGSHSLFEEEAETESAEAKPRRMPVGALIAAGLILAAAGGGWYWWHKNGHPGAASSYQHPANAAALVTPPPANTQSAPVLSPPSPSSSTPSTPENSKVVEASGHPSATASAQPVSASLTSDDASRAVEKPAESRESATKADKKPAHTGFRMPAPSAVRRASSVRNVEPAPGMDSAPTVPGAATPEGMSSLVGSTLQPEAPKPEPPAGGEMKPARLVSSTPPTYPPLARSQRVEGDVTLDALIDATGRVTTIKVISGPVLLQQAAVAAVRLWKYEPATLNGNAVPMRLVVTVKFRLR